MKDYDHIVIWLDYFNKTLSRQKGRRLAKNRCIFDPSLNELIESANDAGLKPTATDDQVRFPRRPFVRSGYIVLEKKMPKTKILNKIADKMVIKRAKQSK
jgi:signal recognition particle subunit SRP19